jgi:hypothetical protein
MRLMLWVMYYSLIVLPSAHGALDPKTYITNQMHDWYKTLIDPSTGKNCCGESVCRPIEYRLKEGHYEVFIDKNYFSKGDDTWAVVPEYKIIYGKNPTGSGVACWVPEQGVLCFMPGFSI